MPNTLKLWTGNTNMWLNNSERHYLGRGGGVEAGRTENFEDAEAWYLEGVWVPGYMHLSKLKECYA